jgi:hypothetical protein
MIRKFKLSLLEVKGACKNLNSTYRNLVLKLETGDYNIMG